MVGSQIIYDSTESFFEKTGPREAFKSNLFRELMLTFASVMSYRNGADILNRMRRTPNGISEQTLRNCVEREGLAIQSHTDEKTAEAIEAEGFAVGDDGVVTWKESGEKVSQDDFVSNLALIDADVVHAAAKRLKLETSYNPLDYEAGAVSISSDEVGVKRQTETRPRDEEKAQPKRVENMVLHVEICNVADDPKVASSSSYTLNSPSVTIGFKVLFGFLCLNGLLGKTLVFFADGAKNLNTAIAAMFDFVTIKIILDWYHLRKKMEETLSLICNNRNYRNETLQKIMPVLWRGNVDGAISMLKGIDMNMVKDQSKLNYLVGYLERVRNTIPNYMLRAELGLRNSSNRGEKANDLIVSNRQKHNGMSWSDAGSTALASISAIRYNSELDNWIDNGSLKFEMVMRTTPRRAKRNRKRTETAYTCNPAKRMPRKKSAVPSVV